MDFVAYVNTIKMGKRSRWSLDRVQAKDLRIRENGYLWSTVDTGKV